MSPPRSASWRADPTWTALGSSQRSARGGRPPQVPSAARLARKSASADRESRSPLAHRSAARGLGFDRLVVEQGQPDQGPVEQGATDDLGHDDSIDREQVLDNLGTVGLCVGRSTLSPVRCVDIPATARVRAAAVMPAGEGTSAAAILSGSMVSSRAPASSPACWAWAIRSASTSNPGPATIFSAALGCSRHASRRTSAAPSRCQVGSSVG